MITSTVPPTGLVIQGLLNIIPSTNDKHSPSFSLKTRIKSYFHYYNSLDLFGVHGVGGIFPALLTRVFCKSFYQ